MSAVGFGPAIATSRRQLRARVDTFVTARRRVGAIDGASRGLIVGCVLAAVAGLASRFVAVDGGVAVAALFLIGSTITAAALGWFRPVAPDRVALDIDRQLGLDERVTTALELDRRTNNWSGITPAAEASRQAPAPTGQLDLADEQIADALTYLVAARTSQVYPIRQSRRRAIALLLGVVLAIAPWVVAWPTLLASKLPVSRTAAAQLAEAARLDVVATRLENNGTPTDRQLRAQIAAQLRQAAATLRQGGGNEQQASKELLRAESAAASLAPQTGEDAALTLSRIADALNANPTTQPVTKALDRQDASQTAAALNQVASTLPSMSPDGRQSVAQALQAASDAARGSDTNAADQLQQAADAAKNGDPSGMQAATQALDQLNQASQAQHDVAQAQAEMESSRQAIAQANQNGTTRADTPGSTSPNPLGQSQPSAASASSAASDQNGQSGSGQSASDAQASSQSSSSAQSDSAKQTGGGSGTGSTQHLGAPHDLQGLAQRQVVVPSTGDGQPGSVSVSNKLQTGSAGSAQVDYSNVLPQYRQQAQQVVDGNVVPTGLKQVVKGYFDALAPK